MIFTPCESRPKVRKPRSGERGHLMAGLMAGVAIMLILSTVAFQLWTDVLRRDNEAEMMFRAQDIVRAIQRYRKDHGGVGPLKLEDLMEPGPKAQYYLRQLYTDPLVADGKWGLLFAGPDGTIIDPNAEVGPGGVMGLGGSMGLGGGLSGLGGRGGGSGSGLGGGQSGSLLNPSSPGGQGAGKQPGLGGLGQSPLNRSGAGDQQGLPIAGVRTLCEEDPFRLYNGRTEYREWLFTYLDLEARRLPGSGAGGPQLQPGIGGRPGGPGGGVGGRGGGLGGGFGNQPGGTNSPGFGSRGTQRRPGAQGPGSAVPGGQQQPRRNP